MSDRLAISATFSVLLMAVYVLFGANVARVSLDQVIAPPAHAAAIVD